VPEVLEKAAGQEFGRWNVERLVLMTSELTPRGPIYSVYGSADLREENRS
jgi:2'-5' RNA ligase